MVGKLFTFLSILFVGCTVIGSQPILSFDSINRDNLIIFLQDSKNAVFLDTEKDEVAGNYKLASNEKINACYAFDSHYNFHIAGNSLYFTSENLNENTKDAQRIFYINHKTGDYKQLPIKNFCDIHDFNGNLWVNINNKSFYEYDPEKELGIQTENVNFSFGGAYIFLNGEYYLRSGNSFVKYGTFEVTEMKSDEDKNIISKISPYWTCPFYIENTVDGVGVKEITSIVPPIMTNGCVSYTNTELSGTSICYISLDSQQNILFIIRSGNNKTVIDTYIRNSVSSLWILNDSNSIDNAEIFKSLCRETSSDFWGFATDSDNNRVFLKISKETLEIKEVR